MPTATVIDQLIVKLGLDPADFSKGRKKAAAEVVSLEKDVKKSTDSMGKSVVGFTGKLLGIATAAAAVKKIIGAVSNLSTNVRQLGIDSRNFNIAANEMRNFQNIGEMFGGTAEGVTRSIGGITKAVYDLAYNGQISDSLIMLGRLGVKFQTTTGAARSFRDITLDTEKAIQRGMRGGTLSRENAAQMLAQAGFDPGMAQAMLEGSVGSQLARQEARRQVNSGDIALMTEWEKSAAGRDQEIAATALGLPTTVAQAKAGIAGNKALEAVAAAGGDAGTLDGAISSVREAVPIYDKAIRGTADAMSWAAGVLDKLTVQNLYPKGRAAYENTIQDAAKRHGIDPEVLAGVLSTESNFDPSAVNPKSGATGIAQLAPKFFPGAGRSPYQDIDTAAKELKRLHGGFMAEGNDAAASNYLTLQAYNAGKSRLMNSADMGGSGPPLKPETIDYPGKVMAYRAASMSPTQGSSAAAGGGSNTTTVNVGPVTVNTQATDTDGIARDFAGATKRKLTASQADVGMR